MIYLDPILVDERIATTAFCCDLAACRGGCCTLPGGSGAPLRDDEVAHVLGVVDVVADQLPARSLEEIRRGGAVDGSPGDHTVRCVDDKDCVFVYYDGAVAKCAIEKAWKEGKTDFRKPISCHLFPIRVSNFGGTYLYYEKFSECAPALVHGASTGVRVYELAKEALVRAFGEEWYNSLDEWAKEHAGKGRQS